MATLRFKALTDLMRRPLPDIKFEERRVPEIYGELVFNDEAMKKYLQSSVYKQVARRWPTVSSSAATSLTALLQA